MDTSKVLVEDRLSWFNFKMPINFVCAFPLLFSALYGSALHSYPSYPHESCLAFSALYSCLSYPHDTLPEYKRTFSMPCSSTQLCSHPLTVLHAGLCMPLGNYHLTCPSHPHDNSTEHACTFSRICSFMQSCSPHLTVLYAGLCGPLGHYHISCYAANIAPEGAAAAKAECLSAWAKPAGCSAVVWKSGLNIVNCPTAVIYYFLPTQVHQSLAFSHVLLILCYAMLCYAMMLMF